MKPWIWADWCESIEAGIAQENKVDNVQVVGSFDFVFAHIVRGKQSTFVGWSATLYDLDSEADRNLFKTHMLEAVGFVLRK